MVLELILIGCIGLGGYSFVQKIATPFKWLFSSSTCVAERPTVTMVPYPAPASAQGSSPIINNQNSNGLFAANYNSADHGGLPIPPTYLLVAAGTTYVIKRTAFTGIHLVHTQSTWSYWVLHLPPEQDLCNALTQEITARYTAQDAVLVKSQVLKQIDAEYRSLTWFIRMATITNTMYLGWLFDVSDQDIALAQHARTKLEQLRKLLEKKK